MAVADTARMVATLELQDKGFSRTADMAGKKVDALGSRMSKIGGIAGKGLSTAAGNLKRIGIGLGVAAGVGIAAGIKSGVDSLITLENATSQVDGAIKAVGLTGKVTSRQIAQWANEIEGSVDAAFDDKDILAASTNLIRYGNVGPKALRETMKVATDLAAKMGGGEGSVQTASVALAKSLANPLKATRLLAAAGVTLDKAQQKQITRLMEAGKIHKAQALLIDLVRTKTDGAADALNGPVADAQNKFNDAMEDASKALATGFLPLMTEVADFLSAELAKPATISMIRDLGGALADAGREAFEFIKKIPWDAVKTGLGQAATFAGNLFDAFRNLPPEAQATIIALAGLNKLSGGAITGIVSELGKGLIKGVLGITAGVVNLRAGSVVGGGVPGTTPGGVVAPGGGGKLGGITRGVAGLTILGTVALFAEEVDTALRGVATDLRNSIKVDDFWEGFGLNDFNVNDLSWPWGSKNTPTLLPELFGGNGLLGGTGKLTTDPSAPERAIEFRQSEKTIDTIQAEGSEDRAVIGSLEEKTSTGLTNTTNASRTAGVLAASASRAAGSQVAGAIASKNMSLEANTDVSVTVNVTAAGIQKIETTQTTWGNPNGSQNGGRERYPT